MDTPHQTPSPEPLLDENADGLDDRLIKPTLSEADSVQEVIARLESLQLFNLPERLLLRMDAVLKKEMEERLEKARAYERDAHQSLLKGRYDTLEVTRRELRSLNREYEKLKERRKKVYSYMQERKLRTTLCRRLGRRTVRGIEFTSLLLTVGLMIFLLYDRCVVDTKHAIDPWFVFYIDTSCCIFFLAEFFLRLSSADDIRWFLRHFWIDLLTAIPVPPVDSTRFAKLARTFHMLRFIRYLRLLRVLRLLRSFNLLWVGFERMVELLSLKQLQRTLKWVLGMIIFGSVGISLLEGGRDVTDIGNISRSIWWSFTTVVTGDFADLHNPTSPAGQLLTAGLILSGMILVGVFTAALTSIYVGDESDEQEKRNATLHEQLTIMQSELHQLKEEVQRANQSTDSHHSDDDSFG